VLQVRYRPVGEDTSQVTVIDTGPSLLYRHYQVIANLQADDLQ